MDFVTLLLAVLAAGLIGYEVGQRIAFQKIHEMMRRMTEDLTLATKQIQESKGGNNP